MDDDGSVVIQVFGKVKETNQTFCKSFNRYVEEPDLDMKVISEPWNLKRRTELWSLSHRNCPWSHSPKTLGSTPNSWTFITTFLVNLTIAEWGLFWPCNTWTAHNFFIGWTLSTILKSKWDLGFFRVKKDSAIVRLKWKGDCGQNESFSDNGPSILNARWAGLC